MYDQWLKIRKTGRLCERWYDFKTFKSDQVGYVKYYQANYPDEGVIERIIWKKQTRRKKTRRSTVFTDMEKEINDFTSDT